MTTTLTDWSILMNQFLTNLKAQAEENPSAAIGATVAGILALTTVGDKVSSMRSRAAYAKQVRYSTKKSNNRK